VKTLLVLGLIVLAIYIALCAGMYWSQDGLLYSLPNTTTSS
jgi:hypothetical protein